MRRGEEGLGGTREGEGRRSTSLSFHALCSFVGKWAKADCSKPDAEVEPHPIDL